MGKTIQRIKKIKNVKRIKNVRIHREGTHTLVYVFLFFTALNYCIYLLACVSIPLYIIAGICFVIYLILLNFFQCPIRKFEGEVENIVVAPADGTVVVVEEVEETEYFHDRRLMISIFMSLFNVHANWYPVEGDIIKVGHQNGNYKKAWLPKASIENERSMVVIRTPEGVEVMARQIAGAMARRIVTYAREGDCCYIDEHMGFIKFGSRVDVYLPIDSKSCVKLGQKTTGNQTIIARLNKRELL